MTKTGLFFSLLCTLLISTLSLAQYTSSDWESRDKWMKTDFLLEMAEVSAGDVVADIGCHEGYLSMHLARKVESSGRVYAVDVRDDRLATLRENANSRNLSNIITILGDYDNPKLPEGALDCVFVIDTYHEITAYKKVINHIRKALKSKGQIMVLEKLKKRIIGKSREEQVAAHSLAMHYVEKELQQAGFSIVSKIENHGLWEKEDDKQMWVILAKKTLQ
ncbi:class I SAM-dependent methyltransferase [Flagellimonas meridianipacifica]|uniref:FkbM family methyltransferase n=1 Tax=Flagellimonas meridianipacifica TaxID=1080225 RepID=A0A2T0MBX5_9FLAO|nr:class I SAM-dependent methyltransferase [Allomuricauda pacifica]PRX54990.1 FkbM family methyltransferase [Allomuricauda pacifica]